jgi:hypothetical protein
MNIISNQVPSNPIAGGDSRQAVESAIGVTKGNRTTKWEDLAKGSPVGKWGASRMKDDCDRKPAQGQ